MRMKRIAIPLVAFGLLSISAARPQFHQNSGQHLQTSASDTTSILNIDKEDVTAISFQIGSALSTFQKKNGTWIMEEDSLFPVDSDAILRILSFLSPLNADRTLTGAVRLSEYGLNPPQNIITIYCKDEPETVIEAGSASQATGDNYIMINHDSSAIYTVNHEFLSSISDNLYDYAVSESLPHLTPQNISGVTIHLDSDFFTLEQNGEDWMISSSDGESCRISQTNAYFALVLMKKLTYQSYLEYNCISPEQYGLNPPAATIEIHLHSGDTLIFSIGATDSNGNYYVQQKDSTEVHTFPKEAVDTLLGWSIDSFSASAVK